jgi:preprotein translocase subunit SecG
MKWPRPCLSASVTTMLSKCTFLYAALRLTIILFFTYVSSTEPDLKLKIGLYGGFSGSEVEFDGVSHTVILV